MILAGDIGGTKTQLGLYTAPHGAPHAVRSAHFASRDYPGLAPVLREFLAGEAGGIQAACLGIAGPVIGNRTRTANLPWTVDGGELARTFAIPRVELINDLVAMGEGVGELGPADLAVLQEGHPDPGGQAALVAAGTGLGIVILARHPASGDRFLPLASEGGHSDFAAQSDEELALLRDLRGRFGHVCVEHVVSGPGLVNIYHHLRAASPGEESAELRAALAANDAAEVVGSWGADGRSALCARALDLFLACYGRLAGNVALLALATAGLYLGGGIAPRYLEPLRRGRFLAAFRDKGNYRELLERIPVRVILDPSTPLRGAARRALRNLGEPAAPGRKRGTPGAGS
jgi:glucokinase